MMTDKLYDQLKALAEAAKRYEASDPEAYTVGRSFAMYVVYALEWYIGTNKAPRTFEKAFADYPPENFNALIAYCVKGDDLSDVGIIKRIKKFLRVDTDAEL